MEHINFEIEFKEMAVECSKMYRLDQDPQVKRDLTSPYYNNLEHYALLKLAFVECYQCKEPFCIGLKE